MPRDEILAKLRERIVGFAASRLGRDAAEDIAQEVLILLHQKYAHVDALEDLLPLSLRIVRYKMMAVTRKAQRRGEFTQVPVEEIQLADPSGRPGLSIERRELRERILSALNGMGDRCRRIFALKLAGKAFAEIQSELKAASINTVYTWDSRCRKDLLQRLGGSWEQLR